MAAFGAALGPLVVAASLVFAVRQAREQHRREDRETLAVRRRTIEDTYVRRYWDLIDRMSLPTLRGIDRGWRLGADDEQAIRLYFRLSEDEADLREQGWVSDEVWTEWAGAIYTQLRRPPFARLWRETRHDSARHREYRFRHLTELTVQGPDYDPLKKPGRPAPFRCRPTW